LKTTLAVLAAAAGAAFLAASTVNT